MPNYHSPDKEPLSVQIPRSLMGKLKRQAKQMGVKLPTLITQLLTNATLNVTLSSEDYQAITDATRKAEQTGKRCATQFNDPA